VGNPFFFFSFGEISHFWETVLERPALGLKLPASVYSLMKRLALNVHKSAATMAGNAVIIGVGRRRTVAIRTRNLIAVHRLIEHLTGIT
jgi:hypothetical protein